MGFLVEALRKRGVDARGIDVSEYAISQVDESVRDHCSRRLADRADCAAATTWSSASRCSSTSPPAETGLAIANLCAATDRLLLSTTPDDFAEADPPQRAAPGGVVGGAGRRGLHPRRRARRLLPHPLGRPLHAQRRAPAELVRRYDRSWYAAAPRGRPGARLAAAAPSSSSPSWKPAAGRQPARAAGRAGPAQRGDPAAARPADRQGRRTGRRQGSRRRARGAHARAWSQAKQRIAAGSPSGSLAGRSRA